MWERLKKESERLGFARLYALSPARLDGWAEEAPEGLRAELNWDIPAAYPRARCVLLGVFAYAPFPYESPLPGYYFASNRCYFAARALTAFLQEAGHYAEEAKLPLRAFARETGIGAVGRNGLLRIAPYGSRIALAAVATDALEPQPFDDLPAPAQPCPPGCALCAAACPTQAISDAGMNLSRCMRDKLRTAEHPDFAKEAQRRFIGCEECMFACPFNRMAGAVPPDAEAEAAFDLRRLISGDTKAARALAGKNMTGGGKLSAEAIAFAARQKLYEDEIRAAGEGSQFPAVRAAAAWALNRYFKDK